MKFFSRKKLSAEQSTHAKSKSSYYDYYDSQNVVPNTIEYYLEFGQEMEVEDVFLMSSETMEEEDKQSTTFDNADETTAYSSYKAGGIPLLTIVDASTNVPITQTTIVNKVSTTVEDDEARELEAVASAANNSTVIMEARDEDEDAASTAIVSTTVSILQDNGEEESAQLEVSISEYESEINRSTVAEGIDDGDDDDTRTYCTISTVGFKSAAASAQAAQEFAAKYMSYRSSCEALKEEHPHAQDIVSPNAKTKIILHADASGEKIEKMESAPIVASPPSPKQVIPFSGIAVNTHGNERDVVVPHIKTTQTTPPSSNTASSKNDAAATPALVAAGVTTTAATISTGPRSPTATKSTRKSLKSALLFRRHNKKTTAPSISTRKTRFSHHEDDFDGSTIATRATLRNMLGSSKNRNKDAAGNNVVVAANKDAPSASPAAIPTVISKEAAAAPKAATPLAILYDDKRNHVAFLRCAPRRRGFDFPIGKEPITHVNTTTVVEEETRQAQEVEERDPPPAAATFTRRSILDDASSDNDDDDDSDAPSLQQAGSTITAYKRKLAELQKKHDEVIQLLDGNF